MGKPPFEPMLGQSEEGKLRGYPCIADAGVPVYPLRLVRLRHRGEILGDSPGGELSPGGETEFCQATAHVHLDGFLSDG